MARRAYIADVSTTLMTADELLRLNLPNKRTELVRGRLIVREPAGQSLLEEADAFAGERVLPGLALPLRELL
jgi:hypothetical protein